MKVSDRLAIVDKIGRELQARYTFEELYAYLAAFGVGRPKGEFVNSKWAFTKAALANVPLETVGRIADDLDLGSLPQAAAQLVPPIIWQNRDQFRLFISHISKDKEKATRLRDTLAPYGISAFVAHEDIRPTVAWQTEIERALFCMDAFLAIHTLGFSASSWTQQEIGFAVARGIKILSLKMGEDPTGFISKHQAIPRQRRNAEAIAQEIDSLLATDALTKHKLESAKSAIKSVAADAEIPF